MATANQNITIRVAVVDGDKVRRELTLTGEQGQRALAKIQEATKPASRELVALNVVGEQVRYGMENLAEGSGSLGTSLMRLGPYGLAAAAAIGAVGFAVTAGLKEFREGERVLNQLNAALATTDHAAGVTAQQITELGNSVEKSTLFKKSDIQQAAAALTSFQNVAGTTFTRALELSADLAVRLGTDVPTAAETLGRALERPENGLGRLTKQFSDLSFRQKESIDQFLKQGDVASAQAVILSYLEEKTRGLAEAQIKTSGEANALSDAWDNLMESLGRTVSESGVAQASLTALTSAVNGLRAAIDPTQQERKSQLEKEIAELEGYFGTRLDRAVLGSAPALDAKKAELQKLNDELAAAQKAATDEQNAALESADKAATQRRNDQLLELQKKYLKENEDLSLTSQQKILKEAQERRKQIIALNQGDENTEAARSALAALNASTRARLSDANTKDGESETSKRRRQAIDEINRAVLQTKPSFDVAKAALDDWRENLIEDLGGASAANQQYVDLIEQIYNVRLKQIYDKSIIDSSKWADGAARGLKRYADEATNAAKNSEKVFGDAAGKIEDTLVDMVSTGEFSMKKLGDLVTSIQQDILRSFIRQNISGPIANGLSSMLGGGGGSAGSGGGIFGSFFSDMFAGVFHTGGAVGDTPASRRSVPSYLFANAPRFHNGLMPDEFPAILQRGETVVPKGKSMGGMNINFNVSTPNAQSFMDSQGQIMAKLAGNLQRYKARNG